MGWDGIGWDGMGWDRIGWDGIDSRVDRGCSRMLEHAKPA